MKIVPTFIAAAAFATLVSTQANALTIDFNDLTEGAVLTNQYAPLGISFSANGFSGGDWAPDTGMTVTSSDIPAFGGPSPINGKVLHAYYADWLGESGNPSFSISFATAVNSVKIDFVDVEEAGATYFNAYNGTTLLGTVAANTIAPGGITSLTFASSNITSVKVAVGTFTDWVGVDSVSVSAVPEPATTLLFAGGVAMLAAMRRRLIR